MQYDVAIVGGGPAGLSAALALGRARQRVLLFDSGPRRNAAAVHLHNFVTRDGTQPTEFRRIGREQLAPYANVTVRDALVDDISGERDAFTVQAGDGAALARRVLLCTGMIDDLPALEGYREFWGTSIFQCPYCHGWEVQDQRFAFLTPSLEMLEFASFLRNWSARVVALTDARFAVPSDVLSRLESARVRVDPRPLARLVGEAGRLQRIEFESGPPEPLDVLFARPPQRQVPLVTRLGLALDPAGFVQVDPIQRETSQPGIYAGGDLTTPMQGAILAAASAVHAATMLAHGLTAERVRRGELS
ncbi:MAG TPA: NAD(P)/FAD-dependent oxidoreductase [Polyangiaceae bacterium]|nr:NAD(P)/FAD-dependent oxidoreductase [Polyangiaceae bacterium]